MENIKVKLEKKRKYVFLLKRNTYKIPLLLCLCINCSARGPVFPSTPTLKRIELEGSYRFDSGSKFYHKNLASELVLEKSKSRRNKNYFVMRSLGQNINGSIRQRTYEGLAYYLKEKTMELHTERCYIHGKQDWEDPIIPLERWDCDHLFFAYKSPSNFRKREILKPVETDKTKYSEWFLPTALIPIPILKSSLRKPVFFAGQIIPLDESPKTRLVIVWGYSAGKLLRKGQILRAQNGKGKSIGKLKVLSRPGDFVVCRWLGVHLPQAKVAYALKAAYETQISL